MKKAIFDGKEIEIEISQEAKDELDRLRNELGINSNTEKIMCVQKPETFDCWCKQEGTKFSTKSALLKHQEAEHDAKNPVNAELDWDIDDKNKKKFDEVFK